MSRLKYERVWGYVFSLYCACLLISNVLGAKVFTLGPVLLPCAVIIFPVVYILNDVMAEIFPLDKVRQGIFMAFGYNVLAVICYEIAIRLPSPGGNEFAMVLGSTWRTLVGSFIAYLVGANSNAYIMSKMHKYFGERGLFLRCVLSTLVGELLDASIFISVVFIGVLDNYSIFTMIVAQALFKTMYEIVVFPITRRVIFKIKRGVGNARKQK